MASGFCFTILGPAIHSCRVTSYHCLSCTHLDGRPSILTLQACWYLKNGGILQRPCRLKKTNCYLHVCICIYYARCSLPTSDCRLINHEVDSVSKRHLAPDQLFLKIWMCLENWSMQPLFNLQGARKDRYRCVQLMNAKHR